MQYVFDVPGILDTLLVSLEQDDAAVNKDVGQDHRQIGFHIMKVRGDLVTMLAFFFFTFYRLKFGLGFSPWNPN